MSTETTASSVVENTQRNVKKQYEEILQDAKSFLKNVQEKKTLEERELRVVSIGLLAFWTVLAVLLPGVLRVLLGGWSISENVDSVRSINEFVRLSGAFSGALLLLNYLAVRWSTEQQKDVLRVMAFFNCIVTAVTLIVIMSGGAFMYYLVFLIAAGLAFLYGKAAKLF